MNPVRKEYEMNMQQFASMLSAAKPVPYLVVGGNLPRSALENSNDAWRKLGRELGFVWNTAQKIEGKSQKHFTAIPVEEGS